jgi:hypothetical protein
VLGVENRQTLNTTMILARAYSGLGLFDGHASSTRELVSRHAADARRRAHDHHDRRQQPGDGHLKQQGRFDEKRKLYEESLDAKRRTLGPSTRARWSVCSTSPTST